MDDNPDTAKDTFITFVTESTVDWNDTPPTSTVFGITGDIDPTEEVDETPVKAKDKSITLLIVPNEDVDDTPVNETVSSARFPHSLSFHAFAPQPVARTASRFQYA